MDTFELVSAVAVTAVHLGAGLFLLSRGLFPRPRNRSFDKDVDQLFSLLDDDQQARIVASTAARYRRLGLWLLVGLGVASVAYWGFTVDPRPFSLLWQLCLFGLLIGEAVDAFAGETRDRRRAGVRVANATRASVGDVVNPVAITLMLVGLVAQIVSVVLAFRVLVRAQTLGAVDWLVPAVSVTVALGAGVVSLAAVVAVLRRPAVATSASELACILGLRRARIQQLIVTFYLLGYLLYQLPSAIHYVAATNLPYAARHQMFRLQWAIGFPGGMLMLAGFCLSSWRGPGARISRRADFPEEKIDRGGPDAPVRSPAVG